MSEMIRFVCDHPEHRIVNRDRTSQNLTVHLGKWAVCPAGLADGHVWAETGGVDYGDVFRKHVAERPLRTRARDARLNRVVARLGGPD